MRIKYSPSAGDKLQQMKKPDNPRQCPSVEKMIGIPSPYFFYMLNTITFSIELMEILYILLIFIMNGKILCGKCLEVD